MRKAKRDRDARKLASVEPLRQTLAPACGGIERAKCSPQCLQLFVDGAEITLTLRPLRELFHALALNQGELPRIVVAFRSCSNQLLAKAYLCLERRIVQLDE